MTLHDEVRARSVQRKMTVRLVAFLGGAGALLATAIAALTAFAVLAPLTGAAISAGGALSLLAARRAYVWSTRT